MVKCGFVWPEVVILCKEIIYIQVTMLEFEFRRLSYTFYRKMF